MQIFSIQAFHQFNVKRSIHLSILDFLHKSQTFSEQDMHLPDFDKGLKKKNLGSRKCLPIFVQKTKFSYKQNSDY